MEWRGLKTRLRINTLMFVFGPGPYKIQIVENQETQYGLREKKKGLRGGRRLLGS